MILVSTRDSAKAISELVKGAKGAKVPELPCGMISTLKDILIDPYTIGIGFCCYSLG